MSDDLYKLLGLRKRNVTPDQIKKAYRKQAMRWHPDRCPGDAKAAERFKEVQAAYDILSDEERRARYDTTGDTSEKKTDESKDAATMMQLCQVYSDVVSAIVNAGRSPKDVDIIASMKASVCQRREEIKKEILNFQKVKNAIAPLPERLSAEEGTENFLRAAAEASVVQVEQNIAGRELIVAQIEEGLIMLARFKFRMDAKEPPKPSQYSWQVPSNWIKSLERT